MATNSRQTWTLSELEPAAAAILQQLRRVPGLQQDRIVIIGGLAVMRHVGGKRETEDIDFLITSPGAPQSVKTKLLALPDTPFRERSWQLGFVHPIGDNLVEIPIDFFSNQDFPFTPVTAVPIGRIQPGQLPYIALTDLFVLKIFSCGLRYGNEKKARDGDDADLLVETVNGPLQLTATQHGLVRDGLDDLITYSTNNQGWWRARLGI